MDGGLPLQPGVQTLNPPAHYPAIPSGFTYWSALQASICMIIIQTAFTAMLIPLLTILLVGSHRELRRKSIYYLSIFIVLVGIATGTMSVIVQVP